MTIPGAALPDLTTLLQLLSLRKLGVRQLQADPGPGPPDRRLFGGLVASQAVVAAAATVDPERPLHSLHSYFLRPGRHGPPIDMDVDEIRNGRSFATRRVVASQQGEAIFNLAASFKKPEPGVSHQRAMPQAIPPEQAEEFEDMRVRLLGGPDAKRPPSAVEVRMCKPLSLEPLAEPDGGANQPIWMRIRGTLPDDPMIHTAMLVYASDRALLSTASRPHGLHWGRGMGASLDHSVWIHRPFRFDDWLLYSCDSPVAHAARGLCFGSVFTSDGEHVATVAQEGLIRFDP
ncbi:thioesterase family protein [Myxococcota bacterium]|nr:thioesterase family protein [Myxococcota bacterium]